MSTKRPPFLPNSETGKEERDLSCPTVKREKEREEASLRRGFSQKRRDCTHSVRPTVKRVYGRYTQGGVPTNSVEGGIYTGWCIPGYTSECITGWCIPGYTSGCVYASHTSLGVYLSGVHASHASLCTLVYNSGVHASHVPRVYNRVYTSYPG